MADKELIIKIPEELVSELDDDNYQNTISWYDATLYDAIKNAIPLPKGHGKIVDADKTIANAYEIYSAFGTPCIITADQMYAIRQVLNSAKAIIEADKSEMKESDKNNETT